MNLFLEIDLLRLYDIKKPRVYLGILFKSKT